MPPDLFRKMIIFRKMIKGEPYCPLSPRERVRVRVSGSVLQSVAHGVDRGFNPGTPDTLTPSLSRRARGNVRSSSHVTGVL
ncbi:hypothetical protein KYC5002_25760 [Archangium violaceum]|uniref:hypothetical protein n=1 Tax=Archangium violaceum TaxID=83451 RepID=UPI002B27F7C5|nr:hypothetical protein KYC5002_25760 [Archangium gephyra]